MKIRLLLTSIGWLVLATSPTFAQGTSADYQRADALWERTRGKVSRMVIQPHWFADGDRFWYRNDLPGDRREFLVVDALEGERRPAFDASALADALTAATGTDHEADRLPIDHLIFEDDGTIRLTIGAKGWRFDPEAGNAIEAEPPSAEPNPAGADRPRNRGRRGDRRPPAGPGRRSPDGQWTAILKDHNLFVRSEETGDEVALSTDGNADAAYEGPVLWSPDSSRLIVRHVTRGEDRKVHLIESSPKDQLQPKLQSYDYRKPGDRIPIAKPRLFDVAKASEVPICDDLFPNPWSIDEIRWAADSSRFTFAYNERGHQVLRIIAVDSESGQTRAIIDERSSTFLDYAHKRFAHYLNDTNEILWMSERDGWNHLYLIDADSGEVKRQVTQGEWVVRGVDRVDEENRRVWFRAVGILSGQDPYYIHFAHVGLDDGEPVLLTEGDGTHEVEFSPDRRFLIDRYSRVDQPPIIELRSAEDGRLIRELERADWSALLETGWRVPERFVAKGRDGETDIHGVIFRPTNFDPERKYPVIEQIYAGPQGAFVPKAFAPFHSPQALAELGFVVVQIDGMGTNWRSKAFHDVCWRNLADAGFPDRIAWLKAASELDPALDLSRVGLYGGSAGGQNALGGLLFHGDFYKVAVADCGCHDNRMDKIWWNELWMGWPVGPEYAASSNVVNAHRLRGKLLLTVGELDRNVDPASTMQVVDALIRAGKDFDLVVFPNAGHGAGSSPYGQRRLRDFFVRHLLKVEPPDWNLEGKRESESEP